MVCGNTARSRALCHDRLTPLVNAVLGRQRSKNVALIDLERDHSDAKNADLIEDHLP